jgi:folylpolyglutamate synthase/dihydropteroate synthase
MLKNKNTEEFLSPLTPYIASLTAVAIEDEPMGQVPEQIAASAKAVGVKEVYIAARNDIKSSIEAIIKKEENDFILLICGSLYLAGNILWQNNQVS